MSVHIWFSPCYVSAAKAHNLAAKVHNFVVKAQNFGVKVKKKINISVVQSLVT